MSAEPGQPHSISDAEDWRSDVASLYDRLSRAIDKNSGIHLSPAEVDLIVLAGGFKAISDTLSAHQRALARARLVARGISIDTGSDR